MSDAATSVGNPAAKTDASTAASVFLSIISSAAGRIPAAMIADTARPAPSMSSKWANSVPTAAGSGTSRTSISLQIPSVPSEPTNSPTRS